MDLSNTEIKIVVKNMAREMVKRATVKNAGKALNGGSYELVSLGGGMYHVQTPSGDLVKDRYGKPLKVSKENNGYAFRDGETLYTNRTKAEVLKYAAGI